MMPKVVYTTVFKNYDLLFPPKGDNDGIDFIVFTDDPQLSVPGWKSVQVNIDEFENATEANRFFKMRPKAFLSAYSASIYLDANIRITDGVGKFFTLLNENSCGLMLYRHLRRKNLAEEAVACFASGKVSSLDHLQKEILEYKLDGYNDELGLFDCAMLVRLHSDKHVDSAMDFWWHLFKRHMSRDQISLPYVLWKKRVKFSVVTGSLREGNEIFFSFPHAGNSVSSRLYAYSFGRSYDSNFYHFVIQIWAFYWRVRKVFFKTS